MGIQHLILLLIQQTILQMIQRTIPHSIPQMILLRTQPLTRRGTPLQTQPVILVQNLRMLQLQNDVYHGVQTVDSPGLQNALLMNAGVAMIALPVQPGLVGHGVQPVDSPGQQNALLMNAGVAMIALLVQPELVYHGATNGQPWATKCTFDECGGCDDCASSPVGTCLPWCATSGQPWATKCTFDKCGGCDDCASCQTWCAASSQPWSTKCGFDDCVGCQPCTEP